jgi:hypothetical protein
MNKAFTKIDTNYTSGGYLCFACDKTFDVPINNEKYCPHCGAREGQAMSEERMREAFEAWAKEQNDGYELIKNDDGVYYKWQSEWEAFKAGAEHQRHNSDLVKYESRLHFNCEFDGPGESNWEEISKQDFDYRKGNPDWKDWEFRALYAATQLPSVEAIEATMLDMGYGKGDCEEIANAIVRLLKRGK